MSATPDTTNELKKIRRIVAVQVSSMLLWVPCAALSLVFFLNDHLYQLTVLDPSENTSLVEDYRGLAKALQGKEAFACENDESPRFLDPDQRDLLIRVVEDAQLVSGSRRREVGVTRYLWVVNPVEDLDLGLLRGGTAIDREHSRGTQGFALFEDHTIWRHCKAQAMQRRLEEPPLPTIPAYAPARALLLEAADRMEVTLARYAEVRPWLLAFFYAWIGYSLLGLGLGLYVISWNRRLRAARLAAGSGASDTATSANS